MDPEKFKRKEKESEEQKKSRDLSNQEDFSRAFKKMLKRLGISDTLKTESSDNTNKYEIVFKPLDRQKKKKEEDNEEEDN
ncbi:MAG: hypothetical protein ACOCRX_06130 [Candidatus Woesearchaeota archaeon]